MEVSSALGHGFVSSAAQGHDHVEDGMEHKFFAVVGAAGWCEMRVRRPQGLVLGFEGWPVEEGKDGVDMSPVPSNQIIRNALRRQDDGSAVKYAKGRVKCLDREANQIGDHSFRKEGLSWVCVLVLGDNGTHGISHEH